MSSAQATQFPQFVRNLQTKHASAGLDEAEWKAFLPKFTGDVDGILNTALSKATEERSKVAETVVDPETVQSLDGIEPEDLLKRTVSELKVEQARLEKLVGLDQQRTKQLTRLQGQLNQARARGTKLDKRSKKHKMRAPVRQNLSTSARPDMRPTSMPSSGKRKS
jgi:hypothetical protein